MSIYYPQAAVVLRVTWEDFGTKLAVLNQKQDIPIACKNIRVERNDYSEADTFKATIDYSAFPFDPRCIRACGITVCMEDRKKLFDGSKPSVIVPSRENTVFIGFSDESEITFDEETRVVNLEGRDYTALFVDAKRNRTDPISLSKPIDQIINDLIQEQEATKEIVVENRTGAALPTLAQLAPDFNPLTAVKNQKRKETYWDIMQDIVARVGLVGFIELDKYVITKPQNIYEKKNIKHFIYGGNIQSMKFSRKLGRSKDFNVKVRSVNLLDKRIEEALLPEEATDPTFIANFGNSRITTVQLDKDGKKIDPPKDADFMTFFVKDVNSKEQLIKIGESVYEELSRQQIEGLLKTFEMEIPEEVDTGTSPIKFNQIRNGTAIRIFMSQDELNQISSESPIGDKIAFLIKRGYPQDLAKAFAESLNRINTAFYTKSVAFNHDSEDGFSMELEFINFTDLDQAMGVV